LKENQIPATFHFVTKYIHDAKVVANIRTAFKENFVIGIRFPTELEPEKMTAEEIGAALTESANAIAELIGKTPALVSLPYGAHTNGTLVGIIHSLGFRVTSSNLDVQDYSSDSTGRAIVQVYANFFAAVAPGAGSLITVHHDIMNIYSDTSIIRDIASLISQYGYQAVTLDNCVDGLNAYQENGSSGGGSGSGGNKQKSSDASRNSWFGLF
jgi:peptidoglycan/xylan/chitin deacetylase (PgdA/CDA1 family)